MDNFWGLWEKVRETPYNGFMPRTPPELCGDAGTGSLFATPRAATLIVSPRAALEAAAAAAKPPALQDSGSGRPKHVLPSPP